MEPKTIFSAVFATVVVGLVLLISILKPSPELVGPNLPQTPDQPTEALKNDFTASTTVLADTGYVQTDPARPYPLGPLTFKSQTLEFDENSECIFGGQKIICLALSRPLGDIIGTSSVAITGLKGSSTIKVQTLEVQTP